MTPASFITDHLDTWTSAIKAKSSAGRGGGKKQEFYGIKKLRELILELAVRGLLVPQDAKDEPASELLKRIRAEEARLVKADEIKKRKSFAQIKEVEWPFSIPESWEWVRLGSLGFTQTGGTPSKSNPEYFGDDLPFIKPADISSGSVDYQNEALSLIGSEKLGRVAPAQSLLMVCIGTIGKCALIDRDCAFNQQINSVTPYLDISKYLYRTVTATFFQSLAWKNSSSTTIAILNKGKWESIPLPLPPLAEQHRIVAKVDELMALCDKLEQQQEDSTRTHAALVETLLGALTVASVRGAFAEAWQRIASHFDTLFTTESSINQLKQTILQLAVMGKLVEQDAGDEPAMKLIHLIARDRASAIKAKEMRKPKAIDPYEGNLPFELPTTWIWSQIGQLVAAEDNAICDGPFGSKLKTSHYIEEKGFTVIRLGNIGIGEFIWGKEGYISEGHFKSLSGNHTQPGDLIVAGMAEPLVRCCEVPLELGPAVNKADCFRVRLHQRLNRIYVKHFFNSPVAKLLAGAENHGMTRQRINLGNAKALPFPLPPLAEQHRIVAKVDELMTLCERLKARLQNTQTTQLHLADSLVEAAIR